MLAIGEGKGVGAMKLVAVSLCALMICDQSHAQSLAKLSVRSYEAFECAALASTANFEDERQRLFNLAYDQGKEFLQAYAEGKIVDADIQMNGFSMAMHDGPSIDFKLGVIWSNAYRDAHDDIWRKPDGSDVNVVDWTDRAILKFTHRGCRETH